MPPGDGAGGRGTWQRDRSATAQPIRDDRPARCGGPDYTDEDRAELARQSAERRELWLRDLGVVDERKRRRAETATRERTRHRSESTIDDDEDEDEIKEPERYAVTLLKQDNGAWDRVQDDSGSGVLG